MPSTKLGVRSMRVGWPAASAAESDGAVHRLSQLVDPIWKGGLWSVAAKNAFDGLLYALVTAGAFGWLWPA